MGPKSKAKSGSRSEYKDKDKPTQIRFSNITAAKGELFHSIIARRGMSVKTCLVLLYLYVINAGHL